MSKKPFNYLLDNDLQSQNHSIKSKEEEKEEIKENDGKDSLMTEIQKKKQELLEKKSRIDEEIRKLENIEKEINETNQENHSDVDIQKFLNEIRDEFSSVNDRKWNDFDSANEFKSLSNSEDNKAVDLSNVVRLQDSSREGSEGTSLPELLQANQ